MIGRLFLVRHGQASFTEALDENYDQLSELGRRQAAVLAKSWLAADIRFDRVFAGPLERQKQTAETVGGVFAAHDLPWPEPREILELAEHQGVELVTHRMPLLAQRADELGERARAFSAAVPGDGRGALYLKAFRRAVRLWSRGELPEAGDDFESWAEFRARVTRGVKSIVEQCEAGENVAVFTSGGPVAAATGWVLGLDDEATMELSWIVQNAACSELLFSPSGIRLKSFNATGALEAAGIASFI